MSKNIVKLNESEFNNIIYKMVQESVEHFKTKWGYPDLGKTYDPWDNDIIDEMDVVVEKYGWQMSPMTKPIDRNGRKYTAYICVPNDNAPRIGDWGYVAADLNNIANKHGMVVEQGKYKNIISNKPEDEAKPKKSKKSMQPEADVDKSGAHYFIIKPRSESNF